MVRPEEKPADSGGPHGAASEDGCNYSTVSVSFFLLLLSKTGRACIALLALSVALIGVFSGLSDIAGACIVRDLLAEFLPAACHQVRGRSRAGGLVRPVVSHLRSTFIVWGGPAMRLLF